MFKITSKQPINWSWCSFALVKGDNEFTSSAAIPPELWVKLARLRELGVVAFELELGKDGKPTAGHAPVVLEELTERQLYQMSKDDLAELAKANKVEVKASDEAVGVKKKDLLDALVARLPKAPEPEPDKTAVAAPAEAPPQRGGKKAPAGEPPVSSGTSVAG